jgi:hypothetical protein
LDVRVFNFKRSGNPLKYLNAWIGCQKVIKLYRPDLIHAQWVQSVIPTLPKRDPLVISYRGNDIEGVINKRGRHGLKSFILRKVSRFVARFADRIMVVSPHMLGKFKTSLPVYIIPSGLDFSKLPTLTKEQAKKLLNLPVDKRVVIFPNNPKDKRKNLDLVKEAINCLSENDRKKVHFHQVFGIPHDQLMIHMKASDFLLFSSIHEGSPNVVKEALANDVAVISVPVGDVISRLENVPGCGVSNSYDAKELSDLLSKNLGYYPKEGELKVFVSDLDEKILVRKVIAIYSEAIANFNLSGKV